LSIQDPISYANGTKLPLANIFNHIGNQKPTHYNIG